MDFSIILVGGHALRKSVLTVSTKHVKMIFFCAAVLALGLLWADTYLTHLEFVCCPEPDFQLCWKMTLAAINTECLKQNLTTVSTRPGSPGLSYYSKAKNMYPGPEVEHRQRAAAASISWKLSSWLSLIWSWCLQWKQNRRPNHIRRITSFFRIASFCPQEI